jgi:glycosyltransferase involved in cell wall biosynthesis
MLPTNEVPQDTARRVLMLIPHYLPGYRAGGPVRSIEGVVDQLGDEFNFYIMCKDRDLGDTHPYVNLPQKTWVKVGRARVCYAADGEFPLLTLFKVIRDVRPHVIYLNSLYSVGYSILPLLARRVILSSLAIVLAPRGGLCPGAIGLKSKKKKLFIAAAKMIRLFKGVLWQASSDEEARDIRRQMGNVSIAIAANLVATPPVAVRPSIPKYPGSAKLVFLSRISPKKNLLGALELLRHIEGDISLTIAGPIEDHRYWSKCEAQIRTLPKNISVETVGPVPFQETRDLLAVHHLLLFPTFSENYGHVIAEALSVGTPVLTSDQTPWRNLQSYGAGWDFPLSEAVLMQRALQSLVDLDEEGFRLLAEAAIRLATERINDTSSVAANRRLFA